MMLTFDSFFTINYGFYTLFSEVEKQLCPVFMKWCSDHMQQDLYWHLCPQPVASGKD